MVWITISPINYSEKEKRLRASDSTNFFYVNHENKFIVSCD